MTGRRHPGLLRSDGTPKLLFRLWKSHGIEGVRQISDYGSDRPLGVSIPRRPVLITGGAGFIGSNLADRLLRLGRPVMILDNLSRVGVEHNVRYLWDTYGDLLEVHVGDVRNKDLVEKLAARCDGIFHFAAQVAVTTSLTDPADDFETNLQGTLNVLEAARQQDPLPPVLFTSTNKVYGDLQDVELIPRRQAARAARSRHPHVRHQRSAAAGLPQSLWLLQRGGGSVRPRLRPDVRAAGRRLSHELHLRPPPTGDGRPGLGGSFRPADAARQSR